MLDLKSALLEIDKLLSSKDEKTFKSLRDGASAEAIGNSLARLSKLYPHQDLNDLIDWYSWHNGQENNNLYPQGWRIMTLEESLEIWDELSSPEINVDGLPFESFWWPIITNDNSDYIVFDVISEKPKVLRSYFHDLDNVSVSYESLAEWARKAVNAIQLRGNPREIDLQCTKPSRWGRIDTTLPVNVDEIEIGSMIILHLIRGIQSHLNWCLLTKIGKVEWLQTYGESLPEAFKGTTSNISWESLHDSKWINIHLQGFFREYNKRFGVEPPKNPKVGAFIGVSSLSNASDVIRALNEKKGRFLAE